MGRSVPRHHLHMEDEETKDRPRGPVLEQESLVLRGNEDCPLCKHQHRSLPPPRFTHPPPALTAMRAPGARPDHSGCAGRCGGRAPRGPGAHCSTDDQSSRNRKILIVQRHITPVFKSDKLLFAVSFTLWGSTACYTHPWGALELLGRKLFHGKFNGDRSSLGVILTLSRFGK